MNTFQLRDHCIGPLEGKHIRLQRLNPEEDYQELYENSHGTPQKQTIWDYLYFDTYKQPFLSAYDFKQFLLDLNNDSMWIQFVVVDKASNRKIGQINLLNIVHSHKRAELGGLWYTPEFWGTYANTESSLLLLYYLFENQKYRRAEWKCDSKNEPSKKAAIKLGYTAESIMRQHMLIKGVNRDTAYFSILDSEWEEKKRLLFKRLNYTEEDEERLSKNMMSV
ncbi:hypothetical protein INT47_000608 [Mucor saturninus]|uniref:N-acetyltransferase domain-containing protein n=1 Tax=Mucor saturninus TaxID=64648 RepID=A0A8H7VBG9_9FUNG|nr:hypothetical protein INT47_000608 [Mucor saturninus]